MKQNGDFQYQIKYNPESGDILIRLFMILS
jgi:hypothetical protein